MKILQPSAQRLVWGALLVLLPGCWDFAENPSTPSNPSAQQDVNQKRIKSSQVISLTGAKQDTLFQYTFSGSGSYAVTNPPSWLSFDSASRKISGYPDEATKYGGLQLWSGGEVIGTYDIPVTGNPLTTSAWHLHNTGQRTFSLSEGLAGEDLKVRDVIRSGITGKGVRIHFPDTGIEVTHEALSPNYLKGSANRDYARVSPYLGDPLPQSLEAHGTGAAALAVAAGWTGKGMRGIAPNASFTGTNFGAYRGFANFSTFFSDSLNVDTDILSLSWYYFSHQYAPLSTLDRTLLKALATDGRSKKGVVHVQIAGNEYFGYNYDQNSEVGWRTGTCNLSELATSPYALVVGALDAYGNVASYSSPGSCLWISGLGGEPGGDSPGMLTADLSGCSIGSSVSTTNPQVNDFDANRKNENPGCKYVSSFAGTSAAGPTISGVVALMLQANPNLTWRDVKHILAATADTSQSTPDDSFLPWFPNDHPAEYGWIKNAANYLYNNRFGFGRANASKAVQMAKTYSGGLGTYISDVTTQSPSLNMSIPDNGRDSISYPLDFGTSIIIESVHAVLDFSHPIPGQLEVELISPAGTKSRLLNAFSLWGFDPGTGLPLSTGLKVFNNIRLLSNAFYGENASGIWTLKITDLEVGPNASLEEEETSDSQELRRVRIIVNGHMP